MSWTSLHSPVGDLTLFEDDGALVAIEFGWADGGTRTPLLAEAERQLKAYFEGTLTAFDLPLRPAGTPFQQVVWRVMCEIPYGQTRSYADLARALGSAPRAVGQACGRNPLPVVIPCHRVLAAGNRMGGYSGGDGVDTKQILLRIEGGCLV